jgi:hypothetical protein
MSRLIALGEQRGVMRKRRMHSGRVMLLTKLASASGQKRPLPECQTPLHQLYQAQALRITIDIVKRLANIFAANYCVLIRPTYRFRLRVLPRPARIEVALHITLTFTCPFTRKTSAQRIARSIQQK